MKMYSLVFIFAAILLTLVFTPNEGLENSFGFEPHTFPQAPFVKLPDVSYEKDVKPIIGQHCVRCHSDGIRNWMIYENAKKFMKPIYERSVINKDMPVDAPLPEYEQAVLKYWYEQGGPQ